MNPELFSENERTAPKADERKYASVGILRTQSGGCIPEVNIAYETWGELNRAKDNAILICHAVSGDSHAIGWWGKLIGPGKAIDTNRYFVIGNNLLGGCQGSTGPSTIASDGRPFGSRFPFITVADMVEVQHRLVKFLGIENLHAVIGGSMGGFLASEWTTRYPGHIRKAFITGNCARANAMQIGFHETARQAILRDPKWKGGEYDPADPPVDGLAIARMLGHLTYLSPESFDKKFGRSLQDKEKFEYTWQPEFSVESYLQYQADGFTKRFDPNSFLWISRAMDYYSVDSYAGSESEYLFVAFTSDWFYPPAQSEELHELARRAGCRSRLVVADIPFGHDSFLLDDEVQGVELARFMGES